MINNRYAKRKEQKNKQHKNIISKIIKEIEEYIYNLDNTIVNNRYKIIKIYNDTDEKAREHHIDKLKSNPILRWKAEEFQAQLIPHDYEKDMSYFLNKKTVSPWSIIHLHKKSQAIDDMYKVIIQRLQKRLEYEKDKQTERINGDFSNNFKTKLFNFDFANEKIDKQDYKERLL